MAHPKRHVAAHACRAVSLPAAVAQAPCRAAFSPSHARLPNAVVGKAAGVKAAVVWWGVSEFDNKLVAVLTGRKPPQHAIWGNFPTFSLLRS